MFAKKINWPQLLPWVAKMGKNLKFLLHSRPQNNLAISNPRTKKTICRERSESFIPCFLNSEKLLPMISAFRITNPRASWSSFGWAPAIAVWFSPPPACISACSGRFSLATRWMKFMRTIGLAPSFQKHQSARESGRFSQSVNQCSVIQSSSMRACM